MCGILVSTSGASTLARLRPDSAVAESDHCAASADINAVPGEGALSTPHIVCDGRQHRSGWIAPAAMRTFHGCL